MRRTWVTAGLAVAMLLGLVAVATAATPTKFTEWAPLAKGEVLPGPNQLPIGPQAPLGPLTFYTNQANFEAAAPGLPVEDFEEGNVPPAGVTTCSDPYDSTTSDACWSPGDILPGLQLASSSGQGVVILGAGLIGNTSIVTGANFFVDSTEVGFTDGNTFAVGMDLLVNVPSENLAIQVFGIGNVLLGSTMAAANPTGLFWGVISTQPIERISILSPGGFGELVDNVQFGLGVPTLILSDAGATDQCVDPAENTNGTIEPGEGVIFSAVLTAGGGDFTGISGTLTALSVGVTVIQGASTWPDLTNGNSAPADVPFSVVLAQDVPCFTRVDVQLDVTSDQGDFSFPINLQVGQTLAPNVPVPIPDSSPGGADSTLNVASNVVLNDVNVHVVMTHTWVGDVTLTLTSPANTVVTLIDRPGEPASTFGCSDNDMDATFDDSASVNAETHCAGTTPWLMGDALPFTALSAFNGESTAGTWTLHGVDAAGGDTGTIVDWELITDPPIGGVCEVCLDPGVEPAPNVLEIPTLGRFGLLLLLGLLAGAAIWLLRRG